jgi:hypothetical protein
MELPLVIGLELAACVVVVDLQGEIDKQDARVVYKLRVHGSKRNRRSR